MRASSWASTTTRRARSVNRSNMLIAPENRGPSRPAAFRGYGVLTVLTAYAFPCRRHGGPLRANRPGDTFRGPTPSEGVRMDLTAERTLTLLPDEDLAARFADLLPGTTDGLDPQRFSDAPDVMVEGLLTNGLGETGYVMGDFAVSE